MMNSKSLKFNTIINSFRMLLTVFVPLVTFPYTSRVFLTEGMGQINFVTSVVSIFILFASLGVYGYGIREGAKIRDDKENFTKFAVELFIINLIATLLTYIVFFSLVEFYDGFSHYKILLLINGVSIGFTALGVDWIYGTYEEYTYITLRQIAVQIFTIITMFIFVHEESDIYVWMAMLTVSAVGSNIFNLFYARQYVCKIRLVNIELVKHIKPIMILFATTLASRVYACLAVFLLGILVADHNVGLYSAAVKVNTILITLFAAMSPVFMPRIIEALKHDNRDDYYRLLKKILTMIASLCIPCVIGLEMVSESLILLLAGPAFADAIITMRILAPIVFITSLANILYYDVLVTGGREKHVLVCTILGAIVNFAVCWLLIPVYVQDGAAVASVISEFFSLVLACYYCYKYDRGIINALPRVQNYVLGSLAIVASCYAVNRFVTTPALSLICSVVVSSIVYFTVLLATKDKMGYELIGVCSSILSKFRGRKDLM